MNFPQKLRQESQRWVADGLISADQQQQIVARYPLETVWYRQSGFLLRALALALFGAALVLVISANWDVLPRFSRSLIALAPMVIAHALAVWYYRLAKQNFLELALFFGGIALGANIFLQAQIYHIDSFFPDGFFWWMVGILPALLWLKSRPLGYVLLLVFVSHSFMLLAYDHFSFVALFFLAAALWVVVKNPSTPLFLTALAGLLVSVIHLGIYESRQVSVFLFLVGLAMLTRSLLLLASFRLKLGRAILLLSGVFFWFLIFLWYLATFRDLRSMPLYGELTYTLAGLLLAGAFLPWLSDSEHKVRHYVLLGFILFTLLVRFLPEAEFSAPLLNWLLNLGFLGGAICFLRHGLRQRLKADFFSGVAMIIALSFGRYIDLVRDYLTSSLLFAVCGLAIWFLNRFWERRYAER